MAIKFSKEEQFLIKFMIYNNVEHINTKKAASLLEKNIGNMDFNKRLRSYQKTITENNPNYSSVALLIDFTYKTKDYNLIKDQVLPKAEAILALDEKGKKIENFEKLSLKEYGQISKFEELHNDNDIKYISKNSRNKTFKELFSNIKKVTGILDKIEEKALQSNNYKSGDLVMNLTSKTSAMKGRTKWRGHEGKLEEKFVTKYNHAAPIFVKKNVPMSSDITSKHQVDELILKEIADADIFRIDPVKLVHKNMIPNLEKVDYGRKKNGEKITWQEAIRERYESFSLALHEGLAPSQIENLELTNSLLEDEKKEIRYNLHKSQDLAKVKLMNSQIKSIRDLQNENTGKILSLEEKIIENDEDRLTNPLNWVGPKAVVQGHSKWLSKNQYDDISKKMFDANPDEKEMICSEFAARCIASTVDQLNKNIQFDLKAGGFDGKKEVIKNPIPKNERLDKIHPERLVNLLKKSGSIEKVENPGLNNIIDIENLGEKQTKDLSEILVKKTLTVLANSETKEAFVDDMAVNLSAYLTAQGIKPENLEQTKQNVINQELGVLYESYKKKPEGIFEKVESFCLKVLEACKLRTKNKKAMKGIVGLMSSVNDIKEDFKVKNLSSASKEGKRIPKKKTKTSSFSR